MPKKRSPMGRPRKIPAGSVTRSILLRTDQATVLEEGARRLGVDVSDLVRASLDLLYPADPRDLTARTRAALELRRRQVRGSDWLFNAVRTGWVGGVTPELVQKIGRPAGRFVAETIGMLHLLYPPEPPYNLEAWWDKTLSSWAENEGDPYSKLDGDLLGVLACPVVRCSWFGSTPPAPPNRILAAGVLAPTGGHLATAERQYGPTARAIEGLVYAKVLVDQTDLVDWPGLFGLSPSLRYFKVDLDAAITRGGLTSRPLL